jgi:hypothetical protein
LKNFMPVETRRQWAQRYQEVLHAEVQSVEGVGVSGSAGVERTEEAQTGVLSEQSTGWWKDPFGEMATNAGTDGRLRFPGKKGEGLHSSSWS